MDVSQHLNALLVGRYEVEREVGAGGMATVYLARDIRHNRKVALKVLRPELGAVLGPERFLSEIKVTANLQHPHLLPLFDSGEAEGLLFYVMPYVEGETLRDRLERERQLPVEEAVRIGAAVASALDYAHRHQVIHRDLKPENILLHEGQALVTDFGIALAVSVAGGARITQTGLSLGTPQYMSPEQATGDRQIDARSDIYSLGAVVYEMLTGEPPHMGTTVQAVIAKVLTERPHSVRLYRETTPDHVDAAVMRALAKLPADRFATAGEFAEAVLGTRPVTTSPSQARGSGVQDAGAGREAGAPGHRVRGMLPLMTAAGAGAAVVLAAAMVLWPQPSAPRRPVTFEVTYADSVMPAAFGEGQVALSRDGSQLAFMGTLGGTTGIFLRRLDGMEARLVRGTESGTTPSFSPDGDWILFTAAGTLKKVPAEGGVPITIADSAGVTSSWGDGHEVVFGRAGDFRLWRVSADGGPRTLLASADSARGHLPYRFPHTLPGGKAALITIFKRSTNLTDAELGVVRLPDGEVTELGIQGTNPRYVSSGHIVFGRSDGSIFAAPFSLRRLRPTGAAVPVLENVMVSPAGGLQITISDNGTLVYKPGEAAARRLVVVDRRGVARPLSEDLRGFSYPRVSPDGRRIALTVTGSSGSDIWTYDLLSRTLTRLTTSGYGWDPQWSRDGQRIAYTLRDGRSRIVWQPWDGSGAPELLVEHDVLVWEISFGPPGMHLAIREDRPGGGDTLFADPYAREPFHVNYDAFPNGEEFVMVQGETSGGKLMAIVNWTEELRRRTQSGGGR